MSKTEVSGKQVKDGSIELVDLSSAVSDTIAAKAEATDVTALDTRVTAVESDISTLQSAGVPNLSDLGEVSITSPSADQVLKYDGIGWVNAAAPAAGATDLDGLSDVAVSSAAKGQFIVHDGSQFVNSNTIEASGAAVKPLILKGAASQTANLLEVQNSAGTALTSIKADGTVSLSTNTTTNGSAGFSASVFAANGSSSELSFYKSRNATLGSNTIVNAGDYLGAVQFWGANGSSYNRAATIACAVDGTPGASNDMPGRIEFYTTADGNGDFVAERMRLNSAGNLGIGTTGNPGARLHVSLAGNGNPATPAVKGLIVQGAASQTANLFELQNSAGTALLSVDSGGTTTIKSNAFNKSSLVLTPGASTFSESNAYTLVINRNDGARALMVEAMGGALIFDKNNNRNANYMIEGAGASIWNSNTGQLNLRAVATKSIAFSTPNEGYGERYLSFYHGSSLGDGFTTGKWYQDFNGMQGSFLTTGLGINIPIGTAVGGQFHVRSGAAARKGIIVQGAASQTANLFEAQNSSGTVLASISSAGAASFASTITAVGAINFGISGSGMSLSSNNSYNGVALGRGTSVGESGLALGSYVSCGSNAMIIGWGGGGTGRQIVGLSTGEVGIGTATPGAQLHAVTKATTMKGLIIQGLASQTANLFEAQNSAGTALTVINSDGTVHAKRYTETVANAFNTSLAPSSGTLTVDTSVGNAVLGALSASVTTWAFTNVPTDNSRVTTVTVVLEGNASFTYGDACSVNGDAVTNGIRWSGGSAPTATANTDIITFVIAKDSAGTVRVFGSATTNFS